MQYSGPAPVGKTLTLAEWAPLASRQFHGLRITAPNPETFRAGLREVNLGDVRLFDIVTDPSVVSRTPDLIGPEDEPYCKLSLQLHGAARLTQDGRSCTIAPGDLALYVTQRPYELVYETDMRCLVVHFPQSFVHMTPAQLALNTATVISREQGLGKVAVPLFEQLAHNLDVLSGPHAMALVRSALDMLVTVLSADSLAAGRDTEDSPLLQQAFAYIEDHLADPELGPTTIARHLYVSVRQLHARFAAQDLKIAGYIRRRRLEAIRQDLSDPVLAHETVHAISARYGLLDAAHVSKTFKAEFGESPTAYRARVLDSAS